MIAQITNAVAAGGFPAPESYSGVGWVLVSLVAIMVGVNAAFKLKANLFGSRQSAEISPQPLDVRVISELVKKEECLTRHNESILGLAQVKRDMDDLRRERKEDNNQLHEKINKVAIQVQGVERATDLQNQMLQNMDAKLSRLVERRVNGL